jgi:RNA polymerase sigma factor (sigma-70 family)
MTDRPAEFDRQLVDHLPLLARMAAKYVHPNERDDAIQDGYLHALAAWRKYDTRRSFYCWLIWQFRAACKKRKYRRVKDAKCNVAASECSAVASNPQQEDIVAARELIDRLSGTRDGDILLERAIGIGFGELVQKHGISKVRIGQLAQRARERITRTAA